MKKIIYSLLTVTFLLIFKYSVLAFQEKSALEFTQKQLNDQSLLAINWVQQSGEYQALTYQAYNIAKITFDYALNQNIANPAVVVDLDETVLDNSPYQASLIDSNEQFSPHTWNQWVKAEKAEAVPGSVEFINYVNNHNGTVFFVSNRDESTTNDSKNNDLELATISNLNKLGIKEAIEETVLLKGEFTQNIDGKEDKSKQWRRKAIANGLADGIKHNIVMLVGDNLNDFGEINKDNNKTRKQFVTTTKSQQGIFEKQDDQKIKPAYITIPNPMYGYWEYGLYDSRKLTARQKSERRKQSLIRWR